MSYDWAEFLELAESLESNPDSIGPKEAALRSAASRAYYAAFHQALDHAIREGFSPAYTGDDHRRVQAYFRRYSPPNKTRRKIAQELNRLLAERHKADYRNDIGKRPESLASHAIGMAKQIIQNLKSLDL
jgi:uncharacterized protein (UPF0332 family)